MLKHMKYNELNLSLLNGIETDNDVPKRPEERIQNLNIINFIANNNNKITFNLIILLIKLILTVLIIFSLLYLFLINSDSNELKHNSKAD